MKWCRTVTLTQPLRDVRRLGGAPTQAWDEFLRQREEAAYARGRRDGERSLSQQLAEQRAELAQVTREVVESLRRAVPEVVEASETAVIRLALEAARKVVAGLPISAELVEAVVREALQQTKDTAEVTVTLHPEDLQLLRQAHAKVLEGTPEIHPLQFAAAPGITRGGCLVRTRLGTLDARRETKVDQLAQSLPV